MLGLQPLKRSAILPEILLDQNPIEWFKRFKETHLEDEDAGLEIVPTVDTDEHPHAR